MENVMMGVSEVPEAVPTSDEEPDSTSKGKRKRVDEGETAASALADRNRPAIKVIDFGHTRVTGPDDPDMPSDFFRLGTPNWRAPVSSRNFSTVK